MVQKRDTLLRWVNCCCEVTSGIAHIDKIQCLSNGFFFLRILDYLKTSPGVVNDPWAFIRETLKIPELKLDLDIVDFDAASSGSEEELCKLIVVCMYLTMVKKPDERIKENTISNFSMEDQRVIETILVAILNDDSLSQRKLVELLHQEPLQESQPSRSMVFYTSSPLSSVTRSSPLKRFLDSPMALRLTRLQKEIHDKNEEIRRLQAEIVAESDETSILKLRMDEVQRKVKQLEKNNTELRQRLRDSQSPDHSGLSANVELTKLRKQLKKLQDEYEATTQRYCDLNIAHDALKNQKEKDRKQIRQLQLDLNEAVAKFDRESAEMQLLLDSIRTENVEIKHSLDEKMQWIEVLEEKNQMCSETHARSFVPKSPCERDSIGFSLLSIESEKLKQELDNNRREMMQQSDKFDSQKILFEEQLNSLLQENNLLSQSLDASQKQLTETSLTLLKLDQDYLKLKENHESSEKQFEIQLQTTARNLELASSKVSELVLLNSSTKSQLETVESEKLAYVNRCSELEVKNSQLSSEHDLLKKRLSQIMNNIQLTQAELQKEKNIILAELELKTRQLAEQEYSMKSTKEKYEDAQQQINILSSSIEILEHKTVELQTSRTSLLQELSVLQTALASVKVELQTAIDEAKIDASQKEILLIQKTEAIHSIELTLKEVTSKEIELKSQLSATSSEKNYLLKENIGLQAEMSRLILSQEDSEKKCKELFESEEKLIHSYTHQIQEMKQQFDESVNEQNVLQNKIQILVAELQAAKEREELLVNAQKMLKEDFDRRFEDQTREHNDQLKQLSSELSNSKQTHRDVEKKCEEAESSLNRSDQEAKKLKQQLTEQLDKLKEFENFINTLRVENETVVSQCADRLKTLEAEKATFLELQANMEEELNEKTKAILEFEFLRKEAKEQKHLLEESLDKLQLEFNTVKEEKCLLATQLSDLQNSHNIAIDELERLKVDFKATEIHLSDTNQSVRNLELQTEQLTTEIQELSNKKSNLELLASQLQESLESTKAFAEAAENESNKLRLLHQDQSVQFKSLSTTVEETEKKLVEVQIENNSLRIKVLDLEGTNRELTLNISSLKSDSEVERQNLLLDLNDSKVTQERLQHNTSEILQSLSTLQRQLDERDEALNRVTKELDLEKNRSSSAQTAFIETLTKFQEDKKTVLQSEIEVLNNEIASLKSCLEEKDCRLKECATQLRNVKSQLDSSSIINQKMDEECIRLKADLFQLSQAKETEILETRNQLDSVNAQLKELADQKQALETEYVELKRSIESSTSSLKQENQQIKSELVAEKEKALLFKSESALEHRKEKAALEARLQLAMTQVKSMQEKLVTMTVANQVHAPLENKITSLTSELQAVCKTNTELEKKLQQATDNSENEAGSAKKEQDCETDGLRKKYESVKKTLHLKEDVINQYAAQFEKMQSRLEIQSDEVLSLNAEKKKLLFENRSLKTEQQHLLAQIAAEKDKATLRTTRHSLALQRGTSASEVEAVSGVRSKTLRASRSEVLAGMVPSKIEVFKAPTLATGDTNGKSIFKIPSSRRESTSSVCSSRSDASNTSRVNVPQGAGKFFTCDDEDGELFSSQFLNEMKEGTCNLDDLNIRRMSELHRRNTLQPPHMRSAYPTELNDERLRRVDAPLLNVSSDAPSFGNQDESQNENIQQLSIATSLLSMNTPPAMNTRKRRSSLWNQSTIETPVMLPRKRRSYELEADLSSDSTDTRSVSSSAERKKRRDTSQTTYQRPGPPTPGRNSTKENISTSSASSSPPKATPKNAVKAGSKRTTPSQTNRNVKLTPASLVRRVQSKLRSSTKQSVSEQNTPDTTPRGRSLKDSKLNIFRKPLGSRGYNSDAKF